MSALDEEGVNCLSDLPWWSDVLRYMSVAQSIGCGSYDYWRLWRTVRRLRPRHVLECGTGISTVVIAHGLRYNTQQGYPGHLTTMEEHPAYYAEHETLFPPALRPFVTALLCPRVDGVLACFRGTRYQSVPDQPYTFVFVDGPDCGAVSDGALVPNLDLFDVIARSETPVFGLIDYRLTTVFAAQTLLPSDRVRFDAAAGLTDIGPCTAADLQPQTLKGLANANGPSTGRVVLR